MCVVARASVFVASAFVMNGKNPRRSQENSASVQTTRGALVLMALYALTMGSVTATHAVVMLDGLASFVNARMVLKITAEIQEQKKSAPSMALVNVTSAGVMIHILANFVRIVKHAQGNVVTTCHVYNARCSVQESFLLMSV